MPQQPAARPPRTDPAHGRVPDRSGARRDPRRPAPPGSRPAPPLPPTDRGGPDTDSGVVVAPTRDLTVNKVLAGAGAAATSAVLGSFFGAAGTVAGAALGSVASTVAATIYQRYLDRTRDTIVARIRPVAGGSSPSELTLPMQRTGEDETVWLRVEPVVPPASPRRRWWMWAGATVLVFVIGLLAVTGIEWAKGSTLSSNDSGTSVGRVLGGARSAPTEPTTAPAAPSGSTGRTSTADPTAEPSSTAVPGPGVTGGLTATVDPGTGPTGSGAPTPAPGPGGLLGGAAG